MYYTTEPEGRSFRTRQKKKKNLIKWLKNDRCHLINPLNRKLLMFCNNVCNSNNNDSNTPIYIF